MIEFQRKLKLKKKRFETLFELDYIDTVSERNTDALQQCATRQPASTEYEDIVINTSDKQRINYVDICKPINKESTSENTTKISYENRSWH